MYFTDKKCQIFNNTIYNKIIRYFQISAELVPKLTVIAKLENVMPNLKNDAKKFQTTQLKLFIVKFLYNAKVDLFGISKCQLTTLLMHRCNSP